MDTRSFVAVLLLSGVVGLFRLSAAPLRYVFTAIDYPGATQFTVANGINDVNQIVGTADFHAFMDDEGAFTQISVPGFPSSGTQALSINDINQIVLQIGSDASLQSFLDTAGIFTPSKLPIP